MTRKNIPCELVSWEQFHRQGRQLALAVRDSGFQPDLIVAIGRGGYLPARIVSDYLGTMDLTCFRIVHYRGTTQEPQARVQYPLNVPLDGRRILLVDDVSDSGETFRVAIDHLHTRGTPAELRTASLDHKTVSELKPDYRVRTIETWHWITYPWAVIEDISGFIAGMRPLPDSVAEIGHRITREHGIQVPEQTLRDALALVQPGRRID